MPTIATALRLVTIARMWLLADGQRVLDDGREAVLAVPGLDVAGLVEDVDGRLGHGRWAGAESQGDLLLPVHERRLTPGGRAQMSRSTMTPRLAVLSFFDMSCPSSAP
jgi:hypothetical protein